MGGLPLAARLLIVGVAGLGAGALVTALPSLSWGWAPLAGLATLAIDFFRVDLRQYGGDHRLAITLDIVPVFFMLGLFGPAWGLVAALASGLMFGISRRSAAYKTAYNAGTLLLAAWAAGLILARSPWPLVPTSVLAAVVYYLANTTLVAAIVGITVRKSPLLIWRENYLWAILPHIALGVSGVFLGRLVGAVGWSALLVALPLPMLHFIYALYARSADLHTAELEQLSTDLIATLGAVVDARDAYTFGHSTHVARYSVAIAEEMGYTPAELQRLHRSALLHDIGKVGIPEQILFKPGRLTDKEYEIMKRHTIIGHEIIKRVRPLQDAATVALLHHERWNGKGYPLGLKGTEVNLDSRITGVADALETMLSDRPYRKGCPLEEALAEIERCSGSQFDPQVVAALHRVAATKGPAFFVNSGRLVQQDGLHILHWSPDQQPAEPEDQAIPPDHLDHPQPSESPDPTGPAEQVSPLAPAAAGANPQT